MSEIIKNIIRDLKKYIDNEYKKGAENYFKEKITIFGVRASGTRKIAKKYFSEIKTMDKKEIFGISEEMLKMDYNELSMIAFNWVFNLRDRFDKNDFFIFKKWIQKYINNWAKCDDFCTHSINYLIKKFPLLFLEIKKWTSSNNRWVRRASAVSLIPAEKIPLKNIFEIAKKIMLDDDNLVQKGYGWMLKDASVYHQKEVFGFIMRNKNKMPRTALRYAIEKMPQSLRKKAMA